MKSNTWYLEESGDLERCYRIPGRALEMDEREDASFLVDQVREHTSHMAENARYRLVADLPSGRKIIARGQRIITTGEAYHVLREIPDKVPDLHDPTWKYPIPIQKMLLSPGLTKGGLILLSGPGGSGKSTTVASTVVSRLRTFGGIAYTVEDPPEYDINGQHGKGGVCFQFAVDEDEDFRPRIHDALRGYPAGVDGSILMVGEIRSAEVAALALESSLSGHLVITTIHGMSIETSLARLESLAGQVQGTETARRDLADSFRLAIHQRLIQKGGGRVDYRPKLLYSKGHDSVSAKIRNGKYAALGSDIDYQNNRMRLRQQTLRQQADRRDGAAAPMPKKRTAGPSAG